MKKIISNCICLLLCFTIIFGINLTSAEASTAYSSRENGVDGWYVLMKQFGLSDDQIEQERIEWMRRAESKYLSHYYGTPYILEGGGETRGPKGYADDGIGGMNCSWFVGNLFGHEVDGLSVDLVKQHWGLWQGSLMYFGTVPEYNNLMNLGLDYRQYKCKKDLLEDGWATKGDIVFATTPAGSTIYTNILREDGELITSSNSFTPVQGGHSHVMVYWGDTPGEDLAWHSVDKIDGIGAQGHDTSNFSTGHQQPENYISKLTDLTITPTENSVYSTDGNFIGRLTTKVQPANWTVFKLNSKPADSSVKLQKTTTASAEYQAKHTLIGSEFTIYTDQACTQIAKNSSGEDAIVTITENGNIGTTTLPFGTYYIKETKATAGYKLNPSTSTLVIDENTQENFTVQLENLAAYSNLQIKKTIDQGYSVTGTAFILYEDQNCTEQAKDTNNRSIRMSVNEYGLTDTVEVEEGIYYLKEVSASSSYTVSDKVIKIELTGGTSTVQSFSNELKPGKGKVIKSY